MFRSEGKTLSSIRLSALQGLQVPVPIQPQNAIEVLITPPLPPDGALMPPLSPAQQRAHLHLHIIPDFTEGAVRVGDPEVVDPASQDRVNPLDDRGDRLCPALPHNLADLRLNRQSSPLPRGQEHVRLLPPIQDTPKIEAQKRERFPL